MAYLELEYDETVFAYRQLENGIHEMIWKAPGRKAVDEWFKINERLYQDVTAEDSLCFLHIVESPSLPSLSYIIQQARELQRKHLIQPGTRSAVLYSLSFTGTLLSMLVSLLNRRGKDVTRFFEPHQRGAAIAWLLSDRY